MRQMLGDTDPPYIPGQRRSASAGTVSGGCVRPT